jgi:hypothetical protein
MNDNTKKSKKQFYKSNFYFYSKEMIDVDAFDNNFKEKYSQLKFKLHFNICENDENKSVYSLYLNERCDKFMFNDIVGFILNILTTPVNIYYKHIDEKTDETKKYDYSFVAIQAKPYYHHKLVFIPEE